MVEVSIPHPSYDSLTNKLQLALQAQAKACGRIKRVVGTYTKRMAMRKASSWPWSEFGVTETGLCKYSGVADGVPSLLCCIFDGG